MSHILRVVTATAAAIAVLASVASKADTSAQATKQIALTFDDLPYVSGGYPWTVQRARRTTEAILDTLADYEAPVTAFVNESQLYEMGEVDDRIGLLARWVDAGAILGNHTFSHISLNVASVEQFKEEIVRGDIVTRRLMAPQEPYQLYFRHPQTHTGDTEEEKAEVNRFLAERGYAIAPHTIDSQDYLFNIAYLDSEAAQNEALSRRICESYVEFVGRATDFADEIAPRIFGRPIPQTIIFHANDINADCLRNVLESLKDRGFEFIALDVAMADSAYATPDTLVTSFGPSWLWRWSRSMNMDVSFRADPSPPEWVVDLFRQRRR